jgi:hypothetical protein
LRSDAHAAREATLATGDKGETVLRLTLADQRFVEYRAKQERASRIERVGDQIERRESFLLPRGCELRWSVSPEAIPLITLTIRRHVGQASGAVDDLRVTTIKTAVGLDHATR